MKFFINKLVSLGLVVIFMCDNIPLLSGLRILGLFPMYIKSHYVTCEVLMKSLAKKGHEVDVYSHFLPEKPMPGFNFYSLEGTIKEEILNNMMTIEDMNMIDTLEMIKSWIENKSPEVCNLMKLPIFQKLLHNPPKDPPYDLVIMELSGDYCFLPWARHLNVPLVTVITLPFLFDWLHEPLGMSMNLAVDAGINFPYAAPMTFFERLSNWFKVHQLSRMFYSSLPIEDALVKKYFGSDYPSIKELIKEISLVLVNHNFALNEIRPLAPKVIPIGGLHIIDNSHETLNKKVKKWLDESKDGCVYFSIGSIARFESFSNQTIKALYKSFENIAPTRILLKADFKKLPPGLPKNVLTQSWLQQTLILSHKNVKAFTTHGGLMGTQESVYYGVPMICIPIFGDQRYNCEVYSKKNIAIKINLLEISDQMFTHALKEIINNSTYKENVLKVSKMFKDRPMSSIDTAIYWLEFIQRHGKDALKSPVVDMPWWQVYLLDIYGFIGFLCFLTLFIITKVFKIFIEISTSILDVKKKNN